MRSKKRISDRAPHPASENAYFWMTTKGVSSSKGVSFSFATESTRHSSGRCVGSESAECHSSPKGTPSHGPYLQHKATSQLALAAFQPVFNWGFIRRCRLHPIAKVPWEKKNTCSSSVDVPAKPTRGKLRCWWTSMLRLPGRMKKATHGENKLKDC